MGIRRQKRSGGTTVDVDEEGGSSGDVVKPVKEGFLRANPIATFHDWRKRRKRQQSLSFRRPSVALANYEISDSRSSTMSSLLLLFAIMEAMCGFVLPICNAFSPPESSIKRYYYEDFLLFQYGLSILALLYLQALIFYYDQKDNLRRKRRSMFMDLTKQTSLPEGMDEGPLWEGDDLEDIRSDGEITSPSAAQYPDATSLTGSLNFGQIMEPLDGQPSATPPPSIQKQRSNSPIGAGEGTTVLTNPSIHRAKEDQGEASHCTYSTYSLRPSLAYTRTQFGRMPPHGSKVSFSEESMEINNPDTGERIINSNKSTHVSAPEIQVTPDSDESNCSNCEIQKAQPSVREDQTKPPGPTEADHQLKVSKKSNSLLESLGMDQASIRRKSMIPIHLIFGDREDHKQSWYLSRDSEGVNLYLRLGAVGFGFGVMIFDGFKIAGNWETTSSEQTKCHGSLWIPIHIAHFIYVFWQTYFLFKHHQVVFNVQKFALRFLLCHLAVANLCQWLKTIVDEISNEPEHHEAAHAMDTIMNTTTSTVVSSVHLPQSSAVVADLANFSIHVGGCATTAKYLAPFLFPCAIEYSLIAGAMFYKMFQKVGNVREESERLQRLRQANTMTSGYAECHRSHKGLFIGLLIFMATLVTLCLFFIFFGRNERRTTAITLYQCTELILLALGTLTCLASMVQLRILKFCELSEESAFDDNLLLVGLIGMIFYDLFLLVPALEAFHTDRVAARLFAAKGLLEIMQCMLQVLFILEASRRGAATMRHVKKKPGRTMVTLLLILNLAMWFVNTFEVKRADNHSIHINYYTGMAWKIITHLALPLIVFFRFHSTVCLSDIWANAYRFRSE